MLCMQFNVCRASGLRHSCSLLPPARRFAEQHETRQQLLVHDPAFVPGSSVLLEPLHYRHHGLQQRLLELSCAAEAAAEFLEVVQETTARFMQVVLQLDSLLQHFQQPEQQASLDLLRLVQQEHGGPVHEILTSLLQAAQAADEAAAYAARRAEANLMEAWARCARGARS